MFSPSLHLSSFVWNNILDLHLWFLRICRTSLQALTDFKVCTEKSGVILIGLPLYVTCFSPFEAFNILSPFSPFNVLMLIDLGFFFFLYLYYLKIWCFHSVLDSLLGDNIFFDQCTYFFYHVSNARYSVFHLLCFIGGACRCGSWSNF